ncbi:type II secretion system protein GspD [Uliginosibacterium gangwonense]|uniref:type II secretion system protein GspD n=1 Tax=Uliginosibacterium gangwonense TaxID=392736 RepID=UPI0003782712|nr:hypothetical protein [Uliginosibacterium gangwonense]
MVKAIIYEVQTTAKESSAIDLAVSLLKTKVGVTLNESAKDSSNAYLKLHGLGVDFSAIYSALSSDDRFKLVSSPVVRVVSGGSAKFSVGQEVPILSGVSYDTLGKAVQSVTYKDSGVILNLTASIKGAVSDLQIEQQISQFQNTTTGVNSTPTLIKRSLSTSIQAADDDVLVLGGLNEDRSTKTEAGLSFLPALFRAKSGEDQKTEVLLLLNVKRI